MRPCSCQNPFVAACAPEEAYCFSRFHAIPPLKAFFHGFKTSRSSLAKLGLHVSWTQKNHRSHFGSRYPILADAASQAFLVTARWFEPQCNLEATASDKKLFTLLDLCVSSLRRGHANLLCIVPILTDDPRRESKRQCKRAAADSSSEFL